jgi:hypothetical protein
MQLADEHKGSIVKGMGSKYLIKVSEAPPQRVKEGEVIQTKFGQQQAAKNKTPYQHNPELAAMLPLWDPKTRRSIPSEHAQGHEENFLEFFVKPTASGSSGHLMGVTKNGSEIQISTSTLEVVTALADAFNRGGFTDQDIQRIPLSPNNQTQLEDVWDKPNPKKKHKKLSSKAKAAAKRRAAAAGRSYPNMVDNIWAARKY